MTKADFFYWAVAGMNKKNILSKARRIKLLILDVDGVLTDGRIIYDSDGKDLKLFDVHDGLGVHILGKSGIPTILVTAKGSNTLIPRARDMQIAHVFADILPKSAVLEKIRVEYKISDSEICFVGDDLVDLSLMRRVGLPVAVNNAAPEVKKRAVYITKARGGRGAVREVVELILKAQHKWQEAVAVYDV
jgi:3-deoxy-D-manno-octulosonate 8-phosphate phosphatase (KDO 8-P phosphatase)